MPNPLSLADVHEDGDRRAVVVLGAVALVLGAVMLLGAQALSMRTHSLVSFILLVLSATLHAITATWIRQSAPLAKDAQVVGLTNAALAVCDIVAIVASGYAW